MIRRPASPTAVVYEELSGTERPPVSQPVTYECDLCGATREGEPAGKGLLLFWRGTEMRMDEPPLCEDCAATVTMGAVNKWALEGEEEG